MARTALGLRPHSGWAVSVVVQGTAAAPVVLARRRVELIDESLPRMTYHAIAQEGLSLGDGNALVARVEEASTAAALESVESAVAEFGIQAVGVVGKMRSIPDDLGRILASHALLHASEGALYERAVVEAASRAGIRAHFVDDRSITISPALDDARRHLGPPWQKDHKLAAAAALLALDGSARPRQRSSS